MLEVLLYGLIGYLAICYAWALYVAVRLYLIGQRRTRPLQILEQPDEAQNDPVAEPAQHGQKSKAAA